MKKTQDLFKPHLSCPATPHPQEFQAWSTSFKPVLASRVSFPFRNYLGFLSSCSFWCSLPSRLSAPSPGFSLCCKPNFSMKPLEIKDFYCTKTDVHAQIFPSLKQLRISLPGHPAGTDLSLLEREQGSQKNPFPSDFCSFFLVPWSLQQQLGRSWRHERIIPKAFFPHPPRNFFKTFSRATVLREKLQT